MLNKVHQHFQKNYPPNNLIQKGCLKLKNKSLCPSSTDKFKNLENKLPEYLEIL